VQSGTKFEKQKTTYEGIQDISKTMEMQQTNMNARSNNLMYDVG